MTEHNEEHLQRIDRALDRLDRHDAPESLVQETLDRVHDAQANEPSRSRFHDRRWANGMAAAVLAIAAVGIVYQQLPYSPDTLAPAEPEEEAPIPSADSGAFSMPQSRATEGATGFGMVGGIHSQLRGNDQAASVEEIVSTGSRISQKAASREAHDIDDAGVGGHLELPATAPAPHAKERSRTGAYFDKQANGPRSQSEYRPESQRLASKDALVDGNEDFSQTLTKTLSKAPANARNIPTEPNNRLAASFLARYRSLDALTYQQANGYWANRYLPGDPAMRRLEAQLRASYPQALTATLERNAQPFDAPDNAALGVYLHATQTAVDGPTRVQLQVGLKAAERQGAIRPAMNVGVVLDLPQTVDVSVAQQVRAMLVALNEQRQTGDRFSVTVAGVPGGTVVSADDYRHGTVVSFIERLAAGKRAGDTLDVVDAFVAAADRLAADDDPNAVLGSSLVLLVTADGVDPQIQADLTTLAHRSAVAGMPVSVVTLAGITGSNLESITLAGQGRLRALAAPAEAAQLIDRELHSASRTVARAVRLRINLQPHVQLVNVIGSYRLDEANAERVRQAEQSIDARLSRTWGIATDRGEDEDGIQIVIPGITAGDNHVVLLDVVVDGPGAVADVQVRYKDLLQMTNGVARTSLSLAEASAARHAQGPLERNVLKNLLAFEIADAVRNSSRHLANGDTTAARNELRGARKLIAGLRQSVAGWENDAELQADEQRLSTFVSDLDAGHTDMLVAALEYAAYRKLLPAALNED